MNANRSGVFFMGSLEEPAEAETVLFGAPFDSTVSFRPGARFGPRAVREDSFGLESYSPYLDRDLGEVCFYDAGDLDLPFGAPERAVAEIRRFAGEVFDAGKRPFMIGGEHLVTLGAVQAAAERYPGLHILHFDAHADLREDYQGLPLSHACVLRRCWELLGDGRIDQFCIRSGTREEFAWAKTHVHMNRYDFSGLPETCRALRGKPVYFTLDLDALDPSVLPGTGTPEPGGVRFSELMAACHSLRGLNIVGLDVAELAPAYDAGGASTAAACKIVRELLLTVTQGAAARNIG